MELIFSLIREWTMSFCVIFMISIILNMSLAFMFVKVNNRNNNSKNVKNSSLGIINNNKTIIN